MADRTRQNKSWPTRYARQWTQLTKDSTAIEFTTRYCKTTRNRFTPRFETFEARRLLTSYIVDTLIDNPAAAMGDMDGKVSLCEAILASNSLAPFGDAPAGESGGTVDTIAFAISLSGQTIVLGGEQLVIGDELSITGYRNFELGRLMLYRYMYAVAAHERAEEKITVHNVPQAAKWLIGRMDEGIV